MQASYWPVGRGYSWYVLSNEIQTMFPQLAKQPGDLFTDHPLYNQRSVVLRKKKLKKGNWRSDIISLYYSLVTLKCIDFTCNCISLFRHFVLNSFLCRVWNMQHITNNSHQRVVLEYCFVANITLNLRWLNTVLRAVSSNSRDGTCFKLDKPPRQRKKQWYTEDDFSKSTH